MHCVVQNYMSHLSLGGLRQNINKRFNSQRTLDISPPRRSYGYTTLVPKFEKTQSHFSRILDVKNTPFSTEMAEFEAQ